MHSYLQTIQHTFFLYLFLHISKSIYHIYHINFFYFYLLNTTLGCPTNIYPKNVIMEKSIFYEMERSVLIHIISKC